MKLSSFCFVLCLLSLSLAQKESYCNSYFPSIQEILKIPEPRYYPFVNTCRKEYTYQNYSKKFRNELKQEEERYKIVKFVDDGGSGSVFIGQDQRTGNRVYLKQLKSTQSDEIRYNLNSVYFEDLLTDSRYIQKPLDIYRHSNGRVTFVYAYEKSVPFKLNREILRQLLLALDYAHSKGVMHRDVKAANIIIRQNNKAMLIDWNLASLYYFSKVNDVELGTTCYEAPEMLLNYPYYHYSLDLWGLGVAMLQYYYGFMFEGDTREKVLSSIVDLFGTGVLKRYIEKYSIKMDRHIRKLLRKKNYRAGRGLKSLRPVRKVSKLTFDLMKKLLELDHNDRLLARQALNHPYFKK